MRKLIGLLLLIVGAYCFVLHEQFSDRPWIADMHPVWDRASAMLGTPLARSTSITKNFALVSIGAVLANVLSMLLGLIIGSRQERARLILMTIAYSGAIYAIYGIGSFLIEPTMLLWRDKTAYLGSLTGTFINRNSAAAYFGSCGVIWLLLIVGRTHRKNLQTYFWSRLPTQFSDLTLRDYIPLGAFFCCLIAMFLTTSRAGVVLSLTAMIFAVTFAMRNKLPPRVGILLAAITGAAISLSLLQLFGGGVSGRFDTLGLLDEGRIETWKSALRMIADYPLFGTGIGTFVWSFPPYRSEEISIRGIWDAAHSTPLELAVEVGLPLTGLVGIGWIVMLVVLAGGAVRRKNGAIVPLAALSIAALAMCHSCVDFTLQISGYSIPFFTLFGAGMAQSFRPPPSSSMCNQ